MVGLIAGFQKVTGMCLASILHHYSWLKDRLKPNNVFLIATFVHHLEALDKKE
jgi:hypothetical protein